MSGIPLATEYEYGIGEMFVLPQASHESVQNVVNLFHRWEREREREIYRERERDI